MSDHQPTDIGWLCRDCGSAAEPRGGRCRICASPRLVMHPELHRLAIAHLDCDAFYAAVEKRDRPDLADRPVIVGGGKRGVVSAACYVARLYGVKSAMPMFKALAACPDAVVIKPDMAKYVEAGRKVRDLMRSVTPLVEPLSIDEAFLDLHGTEQLHGGSPAQTLARLVRRIEREVGVTASIGLSHNKFLAKIASDLDKPRGFAVIGRGETLDFLSPRPVSTIWGVGQSLARRLEADGIRTIAELRRLGERDLMQRYGSMGRRLYRFSRGEDDRQVDPHSEAKSVSAETTFDHDLSGLDELKRRLWPLCETVAGRMKRAGIAGRTIVLKLKDDRFRVTTRNRTLSDPSQLAEVLFRVGSELLATLADGRRYRLIGIGMSDLVDAEGADPPDLLDPTVDRRRKVEAAIDAVRAKLGKSSIAKGRGLFSDDQGDTGAQSTGRRSIPESAARKAKSP